jgi:hypothetical protein
MADTVVEALILDLLEWLAVVIPSGWALLQQARLSKS